MEDSNEIKSCTVETLLTLPYCQTHVPLAPYTYYRIGGPADFLLCPRNEDELIEAYQIIRQNSIPYLILGGGTNILISDKGFHGIVLCTHKIQQVIELSNNRYYISSGVQLSWLVKDLMLNRNYEGVGGLVGIPGTVGGALFMNAGTVNGYICEWVETVVLLTSTGRKEITITPELFGYRTQSFCPPGDLILGAIFSFRESSTSQGPIFERYLQRRKERQPEGFCCGSVFKNPPGHHAGKLIEACGLKGMRYGGAVISPKHANFIINERGATFSDVLYLIHLAKEKVKRRFGIELEEEVRIVFEDGCLQHCTHQK